MGAESGGYAPSRRPGSDAVHYEPADGIGVGCRMDLVPVHKTRVLTEVTCRQCLKSGAYKLAVRQARGK